jgi:hypothetical protein
MLLGSKTHTAADTRRWIIDYSKWLSNTATIEAMTAMSSSTTLTVTTPEILGNDVQFFISGGSLGETATIALQMTDSFGNVKNDTLSFCVVAP